MVGKSSAAQRERLGPSPISDICMCIVHALDIGHWTLLHMPACLPCLPALLACLSRGERGGRERKPGGTEHIQNVGMVMI